MINSTANVNHLRLSETLIFMAATLELRIRLDDVIDLKLIQFGRMIKAASLPTTRTLYQITEIYFDCRIMILKEN